MRKISILMLGMLSLAFAGSAQAADLVTNGTFSAGATGYTTTYDGTIANGAQSVTTNPRNLCSCLADLDGTTNGHGNQLVVDGATITGGYFFQQTFAIVAGTNYTFSFDAVNLGTTGPQPFITARVNGVNLFSTGFLPYDNVYRTYSGVFSAGAATSATITLVSVTPEYFYNDFAIDNIAFVGAAVAVAVPEPTTWAMMIFGFGTVGGAMRHRKRSATLRFA